MLLFIGLSGEATLRLTTQFKSKVTTAFLPERSVISSFLELERITLPADRQHASRSRPRLAFFTVAADDELFMRGWQRPDRKWEHGAIFECWQRISSISCSLKEKQNSK